MEVFSRYRWIHWFNQVYNLNKQSKPFNPVFSSNGQVTVILTVWKRDNIKEQLQSIVNQTEKPFQIWIIQFENHVNTEWIGKKHPYITLIRSNQNFKYFCRFALAQFVQSEFVWILDDDMIPGVHWLTNSFTKCKDENAIIAGAGRLIPKGDFLPERMINVPHYFVGDVTPFMTYNFCKVDTHVDFGCNGWLFKSAWLEAFWQIPPFTLEIAEDIHLSASCKIQLDVPTIVPKQVDPITSANLKIIYGRDEFASWTKPGFLESREKVIRYLVDQYKWCPLKWTSIKTAV